MQALRWRPPPLCSAQGSPSVLRPSIRQLAQPHGAETLAQPRPTTTCRRPATRRPPPNGGQHLPRRVQAYAEPFQPEKPYHKGVVDSPQPEDGTVTFLGLTFSDVYYAINIFYWSALLVSVLTGNELLSRLIHFEHYATGMFASSALFTLYHTVRFVRDLQQHLKGDARNDWRLMLRYLWNAVFWLGFVLWYAAPPVTSVADYTGTPGAVMCVFGAAVAVAAALQVGMFSFMGSPQVPRRLQTRGVYALLRHPQAFGNMCFLIGFSMAGGALWASLTFLAAAVLYSATVLPLEERMLREAFGEKYERYMARTPAFAWALALLVLLELVLLWRFQPWAVPIDATPPPSLPGN